MGNPVTAFLGSGADPTFRHTVSAMAQRGVEGDIIDLGHLILAGELELPLDGTPGTVELAGRTFTLDVPVVARLIDISGAAPSTALANRARAIQACLARYLRCLPWERVVGAPWDNSNFSKAYQLSLAFDRAWSVPRTCTTSDPDAAKAFVGSCNAIYKGASSSKTWARAFGPEDVSRLPLLAGSPVLFQERISGFDVRVHVVGDQVFGEAAHATECDYRTDRSASFEPITVPQDIAADCVDMTRIMRLVLSGIDFKVSAEGQWYFLEANSSPCYQGYDRRAGGAISDSLARQLGAVNQAGRGRNVPTQ